MCCIVCITTIVARQRNDCKYVGVHVARLFSFCFVWVFGVFFVVVLSPVCPIFPVSLDYSFLFAPFGFFSNVHLTCRQLCTIGKQFVPHTYRHIPEENHNVQRCKCRKKIVFARVFANSPIRQISTNRTEK